MKETRKRVFLGGTCNESKWRDELMELTLMDCFNPVVDDWNDAAYKRELYEREHCDYVLYVITPKMTGVYSIAEVVDDSNKRPEKTLFCYLKEDDTLKFEDGQLKSLEAVKKIIERNGGRTFGSIVEVVWFLNREVCKEHRKNLKPVSLTNRIKRFIWRDKK